MNSFAASPWGPLLPVALTGTARDARSLPALPGVPAPDPADAHARPRQLLRTAAALGVVERAGFRAPAWEANPPAELAPPDDWPAMGPAGVALLARQLDDYHTDYLHGDHTEFALWYLTSQRQRLPHHLLPRLLTQPAALVSAQGEYLGPNEPLGERGWWLQAQSAHFGQSGPDESLDEQWHRTSQHERSKLLVWLTLNDLPEAVRLLLTYLPTTPHNHRYYPATGFLDSLQRLTPPLPALPTWPELGALLAALLLPNGPRDYAFDNVARRILVQLPGNALVGFIRDWVSSHLAPAPVPDGRLALRLTSPTRLTPPAPWEQLLDQRGRNEVTLQQQLNMLLSLLPPSYLGDAWNLSAADTLALTYASPHADWLLPALHSGMALHRDEAFALAFLSQRPPDAETGGIWHGSLSDYAAQLSAPVLTDWGLAHLAELPRPGWPAPHALLALSGLRPLGGWPPGLVRPVLEFLLDRLEQAPAQEQEWLATCAPEILRHWEQGWDLRDPALLPLLPRLKPSSKKPPGSREWPPLALYSSLLLDKLPFRAQFAASLTEPAGPAD